MKKVQKGLEKVPKTLRIVRSHCRACGRDPLVEHGFLVTHREDPPSSVICPNSGTRAEDVVVVDWIVAEKAQE